MNFLQASLDQKAQFKVSYWPFSQTRYVVGCSKEAVVITGDELRCKFMTSRALKTSKCII